MDEKDISKSSGNGTRSAGSAVKHRYTVMLLESGQITVEQFPQDPVLATFMHTWAWEIMRDWFKERQTRQVISPSPFGLVGPPGR